MAERGYHDIGGDRFVDRARLSTASDRPPSWGTLTDALRNALGSRYRIHEQRRKIEEMGPTVYDSTTYYEVRVLAMFEMVQEKGLLSRDEIETRMADLKNKSA